MNKKIETKINQWLMAQMGYIGPMLGQHHQFHRYNSGTKINGVKKDIFKITKTIYGDLDERLAPIKISCRRKLFYSRYSNLSLDSKTSTGTT